VLVRIQSASTATVPVSKIALLDAGADANAQGGEYGNAQQVASDGGHEKVVQTFLGAGADINAQGGRGDGHEKMVQKKQYLNGVNIVSWWMEGVLMYQCCAIQNETVLIPPPSTDVW
jgi:hypothetical protein